MANVYLKLGKRVKELRSEKKISQAKLAKILDVHPTYISGIERGIRNMTLKNLEKLAAALKVTLKDLLD